MTMQHIINKRLTIMYTPPYHMRLISKIEDIRESVRRWPCNRENSYITPLETQFNRKNIFNEISFSQYN